ncbi:MAG: hypothetical protein V4667_07515 [Bacteroidota bacterium]
MKTTNYIISTLLLLAFVFNIVGYDVVFRVTQFQIKKEVKRKLKAGVDKQKLHTIVVPKSWLSQNNKDFKTIHEREFEYKGVMYDVVTKTEKDDLIYFKCISDKEETKLFAQLDEHIKNHVSAFPQTKNKNQKLYKKIAKDYFPPSVKQNLVSFVVITKKQILFSEPLNSQFTKVSTPPPELV